MNPDRLIIALQVAAISQALLAVLNLFLISIMKWRDSLRRLSLLANEVFHVHIWFISITLLIFASTTWVFAREMVYVAHSSLVWFSGCISMFWAIRFILQWTYYSRSHWVGKVGPTLAHLACSVVYGGWSVSYALVVLHGYKALGSVLQGEM